MHSAPCWPSTSHAAHHHSVQAKVHLHKPQCQLHSSLGFWDDPYTLEPSALHRAPALRSPPLTAYAAAHPPKAQRVTAQSPTRTPLTNTYPCPQHEPGTRTEQHVVQPLKPVTRLRNHPQPRLHIWLQQQHSSAQPLHSLLHALSLHAGGHSKPSSTTVALQPLHTGWGDVPTKNECPKKHGCLPS
jgi:hypothetical protein